MRNFFRTLAPEQFDATVSIRARLKKLLNY